MIDGAAQLPRRAPWWLLVIVTPLALWSVASDVASIWTGSRGTAELLDALSVVLITFGCVAALRWSAVGAAMIASGSFLTLGDPVPVAPVFFVVGALIVVFTGRFVVLLALDAAAVLWSIAHLALDGFDSWLIEAIALLILATVTITRRQLGSLGRSVAEERSRADDALAANQRVAEDERRRLARELHDVVAHDVTVMAMQCDAALLSRDPQTHTDSLRLVSDAAHRSLNDLRRMMNVLTLIDDGPDSATISADLGTEMAQVAERLRGLGFDIRVDLGTGNRPPDEPAVRLALVPVLRESATNIAKYADRGAPARFTYRESAGRACLQIENRVSKPGTSRPNALSAAMSGGFGLVGLAERVRSLDGTFEARLEGEMWLVRAEIPLS